MERSKYFFSITSVLSALFIIVGLAVSPAFAISEKEKPKDKENKIQYAPGEIIVKFKDAAETKINSKISAKTLELSPAQTGLSSVDTLNAKHKVKKITPAFNELKTKQLKSGKSYLELFEEAKTKFPQRAKRAPKNFKIPNLPNIYKLELEDKNADISAICREYRKDSNVEYAEPNYIIKLNLDEGLGTGLLEQVRRSPIPLPPMPLIPDDPFFSSMGSWGQPYDDLWGLKEIQARDAWNISWGEGIVVAVIDSGVDYNHPDISENIWNNPGEIPNNHIDDDNNGYVDDVLGWDFTYDIPFPLDGFGHGTHVAGIIAAVGNNGIGIIGVAPKAKIMPVKGFDNNGSAIIGDLASAIVYAAENGADVLNNSWGCAGGCPSLLTIENAVRTAYGLGAVVVFAAGNDSKDVAYYSPQNMIDSKPIVVAASTQDDTAASFTNYGLLVDVAAPGGGTTDPPPDRNILSLKSENCNPELCDTGLIVGTDYLRQAGTSMAAPHVAGLAALILSHNPDFTNEEVRQVIRSSADDILTAGFDLHSGAGRINTAGALMVESVLRTEIVSPASGVYLSQTQGSVDIIGTAAGATFKQYELFYSQGVWPSEWEWVSITGPVFNSVNNDNLGTWVMSDLPDGAYTLQLVATALTGQQFQAFIKVNLSQADLTPRRITFDASHHSQPAISGDLIVWTDNRNVNWDIYLYDLVTSTEHRITNDPNIHYMPAVSGNRIIWMDERSDGHDGWIHDIYSCEYSRETGECPMRQITSSGSVHYAFAAQIDGDKIVWVDNRDGGRKIYLYDFITSTERRISLGYSSFDPDISGNHVVWTDGNDVHLYDIDTDTEQIIDELPVSRGNKYQPVISDNFIAWHEPSPLSDNSAIYFYNLSTGTTQRVITGPNLPFSPGNPKISGNRIVYYDLRQPSNPDVYIYDILTNTELLITPHPASQCNPDISGRRIVWSDNRSNPIWDVYTYELSNTAPKLNSVGNKFVYAGDTLSFRIYGSDADGDSLTYSTSSLPQGAWFLPHLQGFVWTPTVAQVGTHEVTFRVTDSNGASDSETIQISVARGNSRGGGKQRLLP